MKIPTTNLLRVALLAAACGSLATSAFATDGYFVQGFGAVNSALGGAGTAGNDQDLIGSIYKNPANGLLFADRTASVVFGDIIPSVEVDSSVKSLGLSGSSNSTIDGVPYLSLMTSWKSSNPDLGFFAGAVSEAGLSFHAATSATNPIFMPQVGAPGNPYAAYGFGGFGDVRSTLYVVRIPVGLAASSPDGWSWGFALAPSIGRNLFSPAAFAAPGLTATHLPVYGAVQQDDVELGMGAQGGLRFQANKDLSLGVSLSSPTWFHSYSWTIHDPSGAARTVNFMMDRPLTAQVGMNYAVTASTHIVSDLGYIAYGSTHGFEHSGFNADGSMAGLGWKDSYTFELGIQQVLTPGVVVRVGYNYCSDPIPAAMTFYNVGSPLEIENHASVGVSITVAPNTTLDASYTHGFSHSQSSPWYNPAYAPTLVVPLSSITTKISGDEFSLGTTFRF
jgi:long-chain fatty acid transport protein